MGARVRWSPAVRPRRLEGKPEPEPGEELEPGEKPEPEPREDPEPEPEVEPKPGGGPEMRRRQLGGETRLVEDPKSADLHKVHKHKVILYPMAGF